MNNTLRDSIPTIKVPLALLLVMGLVTSVAIVLNQSDGWIYLLVLVVCITILGVFTLWFNQISKILLLVAFFLPVEMVPFVEDSYKDLDLTTPLLLVALLYLLIASLIVMRVRIHPTPIDTFILLFILTQLFISISSPWFIDTLFRYLKYDKVFILYYLFINYLDTEKKITTTLQLYTSSAIVIACYGVIAFVIFVTTGRQIWGLDVSWGYLPRIAVTLRDQNIFAAYMITPLLLVTSAFLFARYRYIKILLISIVGTISLAVLFTWSRSGFLGLGVAGLVYLYLSRRYFVTIVHKFIPLLIGLLLLLTLTSFFTEYSPKLLVERFTGKAYGTDQSDELHYYIAKLGWEVFQKHPLGVGRSNILRYISDTAPETQFYFMRIQGMNAVGEIDGVYQGWPMHSTWLEILVAEGIGGFILCLLIVLRTILSGIRALKRIRDLRLRFILLSFISGFIGILASAIFYTFDWMYFFWFSISMITVISRHIFQTERQLDAS